MIHHKIIPTKRIIAQRKIVTLDRYMCGKLIVPIFTNGNMNGTNQEIIPQLNVAYGNIFNCYWWVQDGSPAHRTLIVKERLLDIF